MIKLIKNELSKIIHKKAIYILAIVTILFTILSGYIIKLAANIDNLLTSDTYMEILEEGLKSYDLNNPEELNWYVDDKTELDIAKEMKKYDSDSWQAYRMSTMGYDYLHTINEAKYVSKDNKALEEAQKVYDEFVKEIDNNDWQDLAEAEAQKNIVEEQLKNDKLSDKEKLELNNSLKNFEYTIDGYNYRLKLDIPVDNSDDSLLVDQYVSSAIQYEGLNKDEYQINDYDELTSKREVEKNYYEAKYKLDNDIKSGDMFSASELLLADSIAPVLFVIVAVVMIAGTIISDEFNKGTIKQLLLRPFKRWKILLSKYITSIIVFLLFLLFYEIMTYCIYGVILGFDSYKIPVVLYNFTTHEAFQMSLIGNILINLLSILPAYLIILTITFFIGIVSTNGAVSIAVGFLVFFFGNIINQMAVIVDSKLIAFIPSMCWNFNAYLFGGLPTFKYSNLGIAIFVSALVFIIFLVGSFIVFRKKDIKNQ